MKRIRNIFSTQRAFMSAILDDTTEQIGFGGARGGGKSEILRAALVIRALQYPGSRHLLLRRTREDVLETHERQIANLLCEWGIGFRYNVQKRVYLLPGGSQIRLAFAERVRHAEKYQGAEYLTIALDEATHFEEIIYDRICGSGRVSCEGGALVKKLLSCNPGGVGHGWIKRRFVVEATRDARTVWIPSRLEDNLVLKRRDPGYGERLIRGLPKWIADQWLEGNWDVNEGQYFAIPPGCVCEMTPPHWAVCHAGVDWGYFPSAFAVVWAHTWRDAAGDHCHVRASLKEHRLDLSEQAREALAVEQALNLRPRTRFADPATGKRIESENDDVTRTVAYVWSQHSLLTYPARRTGRVAGWLLLRQLMAPHPGRDHGILTIDPICVSLIREMEDAQFKEARSGEKGEDLHGEDHCLDALRYLLVMVYGLEFAAQARSPYQAVDPASENRVVYRDMEMR